MRKTFSKAFRRGSSSTYIVTLKAPDLVVGNQWASSETEIATGVRCQISRRTRGRAGQGSGQQTPGLDKIEDEWLVYFDPPRADVKNKMNLHLPSGQVLHIISLDPEKFDENLRVQRAVCVDDRDRTGQGAS